MSWQDGVKLYNVQRALTHRESTLLNENKNVQLK